MDEHHHYRLSALLRLGACLAALWSLRLSADVVETSNGSKIIGKVTKIHGAVVTIQTDYAGEINVKQALVKSITIDHPVAARVANGDRIVGTVTPVQGTTVKIEGPTGSITTPIDSLVALWAAGGEDPDVAALRRKWSYEVGVDINGSSGTQNQLGTAGTFKATLTGPADTFQYYLNYLRQKADGETSADQGKAGADYTDNFTNVFSWYVRDEAGFDRVNDISFYDIAASGYGYNFIREKDETLVARAGLSYRYDAYTAPDTSSLSTTGADLELEYTKNLKKAKLHDKIVYDPAFQDFGNYVVEHQFDFEIPITKSLWKLSTGVTNDFNSRPVDDVKKLETIYFLRLVLSWGENATQQ
jgi:hypothetical protein